MWWVGDMAPCPPCLDAALLGRVDSCCRRFLAHSNQLEVLRVNGAVYSATFNLLPCWRSCDVTSSTFGALALACFTVVLGCNSRGSKPSNAATCREAPACHDCDRNSFRWVSRFHCTPLLFCTCTVSKQNLCEWTTSTCSSAHPPSLSLPCPTFLPSDPRCRRCPKSGSARCEALASH